MDTTPPAGLEQPSSPVPAYRRPDSARRSRVGLGFLTVIAVIALLGSILVNVLLLAALAGQGMGASDDFMERKVSGSGDAKILHLQLDGIITSEQEGFTAFISDSGVMRMLDQAERDEDIKAVVLEVNSPGGGVTASDRIAERLRRFRASGKRVYFLMGGVCASGCLYMASAAEKVYAHPTTLTGSIGVIISTYNIEKLMATVGVRDVTFKSGAMKDLLSMARPATAEEHKVVQAIITDAYERFLALLVEGRSISIEELRPIADGRIFTATKAKELKLVDGIGYFHDVEAELLSQLGLSEARVVTYRKPFSLSDLTQGRAGDQALLEGMVRWLSRPRMLYLWRP